MKKIKNLLKNYKLFVCGTIVVLLLLPFLPTSLLALIFVAVVGGAARILEEKE